MSPHRVLTPRTSPEPELPQCKGLWQATSPKRKRSWHSAGETSSKPGGIQALWETEWRTACQRKSHPFQDGRYEDFEPVFNDLIASHTDDPNSLEYTLAFLSKAEDLALQAEEALLIGDRAQATDLYLRACAVLRTSRHSSPPDRASCLIKKQAWQLQKVLYQKAGRLWENPLDEATIPHIYDTKTHHQHQAYHNPDLKLAGQEKEAGKETANAAMSRRPRIPVYVRLPTATLRTGRACPAVLVVSRDRTGHTGLCGEALGRGWGCVVVEAAGMGDCPVLRADGEDEEDEDEDAEMDAVWSSVLDWMGAMRVFDMEAGVVVWGEDGGVVVRMAGTHGDRLGGCVALLGAGAGDLSMLDEISCRLLLVADGGGGDDSAVESNGLWMPGVGEGGLALFEYGVPGTSVVRHPVADLRTVYDWVGSVFTSEVMG